MGKARSLNSPAAQPPTATLADANDRALLMRIGEQVRRLRASRGMTRKLLAGRSQVSERYLAQLEAGEANPSILLLARLAEALGLPLVEMLEARLATAPETDLILGLLKRMPVHALHALRVRLGKELGGDDPWRQARLALVGLRGAGKSTLGKRLADELQVPFVELDREIEREAGTTLSEVFLLYGQAGYRRYERRCLARLIDHHEGCVIATGGSVVTEPATLELLLAHCRTIWLKASPEEHMARVVAQGDTRPMAGNAEAMEDLRRILDARAALYAKADLSVDTAGLNLEQSYASLKAAVATAS